MCFTHYKMVEMVQYESGAFDIISSNFTAHYQADGSFDSYGFWGSDRIINAFAAHRDELLANIGGSHTTHEEQISNRQIIRVNSRGREGILR